MADNAVTAASEETAAAKDAAPAESAEADTAVANSGATERLQAEDSAAKGDEPAKTEQSKKATENGATSPPPSANSALFKEQFKAFSKFGDTKSDGRHITLSQSDKWMKQAKVIDGKKITTTDTGIHFKKFKQLKITLTDYNKYLEDLAKRRKVELDDIKSKLANCGTPGLTSQAANSKAAAAVERLTDVSKYTGSHRQRFDEAGKGKGIAGRKDLPDGSGYVQGYKDKDTYSKTH